MSKLYFVYVERMYEQECKCKW